MGGRRVVVTGMGAVTPIGAGKDEYWEALKAGRSGIKRITCFDVSDYPTQIAGQVEGFDPSDYLDRKEARRMDRFAQFAVAAAVMAVRDAGLAIEKEDPARVGVILGSGVGGIATMEEQHQILLQKGPGKVSPFFVPKMIANMGAAQVSMVLGLKGPNSAVVTACAAASHAVGDAMIMIRRGEAEVMIAGGSEAALSPLAFAGFCTMRAMSTRNGEPERASRPFDKMRDGFVMGEGAGVVVLESLEHALARGARVYGELAGYGLSADAYHITDPAPGGEGAVRAMRRALEDAGRKPADVDYINAHGTSTEANDRAETLAIKEVFGEHAYRLCVSSTKSMTGHLLGAAGGIELIAALLATAEDVVPPTINYEYPDPECDLDFVPNVCRRTPVRVAMSNSFGFGGQNACLVVQKFAMSDSGCQ